MDVNKLKRRLEYLKAKRKRIRESSDPEALIRGEDQISVLTESELRGINEEIDHLEVKILENQ